MQQQNDSTTLQIALQIAISAHATQVRKGTTIPYISHPMAVAALVLEHHGDTEQAAAALLHDAIEDGGADYAKIIKEKLGQRIHQIVQGCTDGVPNDQGTKPPWETRKKAYLEHLGTASDDVLLVSCCDKLHNARAIVADQRKTGDAIFDRFSASKPQTLWYYRSLADLFTKRKTAPSDSLQETVADMHRLAGVP